jgi:hypothetical protein
LAQEKKFVSYTLSTAPLIQQKKRDGKDLRDKEFILFILYMEQRLKKLNTFLKIFPIVLKPRLKSRTLEFQHRIFFNLICSFMVKSTPKSSVSYLFRRSTSRVLFCFYLKKND